MPLRGRLLVLADVLFMRLREGLPATTRQEHVKTKCIAVKHNAMRAILWFDSWASLKRLVQRASFRFVLRTLCAISGFAVAASGWVIGAERTWEVIGSGHHKAWPGGGVW